MKKEHIILIAIAILGIFLFFKLFKYFVIAAIIYGFYWLFKKLVK